MKLKLKESWNPGDITNVYKAINAGLVDDDDIESMRNYLQQIVDYCIDMANDYHIVLRYDTGEDLTECDSAEATQPTDIAKKEEYLNMVEPSFKKGKKIKEEI